MARVPSVHPNYNLLGFSAALAPNFHPLQLVDAPNYFSVSVTRGHSTRCSASRWLRHPPPIHTRLLGKPVRRALILAASDSRRRPPAVMADAMQWQGRDNPRCGCTKTAKWHRARHVWTQVGKRRGTRWRRDQSDGQFGSPRIPEGTTKDEFSKQCWRSPSTGMSRHKA